MVQYRKSDFQGIQIMKDIMFSKSLEDQINFEKDFNIVLASYGDIDGKLKSVSDISSDGKMVFWISTNETLKALSMIREDYPENVIIRSNGEKMTFNFSVASYTVDQADGETVLKIEGDYVKTKK